MKVLNLCDTSIILDDINVVVPYSRHRDPQEIEERLVRRSRTLSTALKEGLLMDVTKGMPETLPPIKPFGVSAKQRESVLVKDDHFKHYDGQESHPKPRKGAGPSALADYKSDGTMSIAWTGPACFPPDAKVLTKDGVKPISKVEIGDMVFTHQGRLRKVVRTYSREYAGKMTVIHTALDSEEAVLTPYHKVMTVKGQPCARREIQTCKPSCSAQFGIVRRDYGRGEYANCPNPPYRGYSLQKVPAGDLTTRDFLVIPNLKEPESVGEILVSDYLGDYDKYSTDREWIWPSPKPQTTCQSTLARRNGIEVDWMYETEKLSIENKSKIVAILRESEANEPAWDEAARQGKRIPLKMKLDYDAGRFFGLYLAEGSGGSRSFSFALHRDETDTMSFLQTFVSERLGLTSRLVPDKRNKGTSVVGQSILVSRFMVNLCGHDCYSKRIPAFSYGAPKCFIDGLLNGFWEGDGTKNARSKDNSLKLGSASPSLAYGIRLLLSKMNVLAGVSVETKCEGTFGGKTYVYESPHPFYVLRISGRQLYENEWLSRLPYSSVPHIPKHTRERQYYRTKECSYVKITSIKTRSYVGCVYDLEVEEDHTYLVIGKGFSNSDAGGYARMNRRFMLGLKDRGVAVKYDLMESLADMDADTMLKLRSLQGTRIPDDAPKVYGQTAPMIWDWARYKMLFTMMETRRLHKDYVIRCNCADEIVVPSYWCKQVFEESGVKKPISVVPLAVDTNLYRPGVEPIEFAKNLKPYIFLSVFGWSLRKGYDVLLKAYLSEFTSDDPVSLLIASRYFGSTDESKKQVIRDEIARIRSMVPNPKQPHLALYGDVLSDAMMPRLFAAADCYVLISRGEGFNLPVCFLPGSKVSTISGGKPIEQFKKGDTVVSHSGRTRLVKEVFGRKYQGNVVRMKAYLNNNPIQCTPEHPVLAVRKEHRRSNDKRHASLVPEWVRADTLKKGDMLVFPRRKWRENGTQTIDLARMLNLTEYDENHVWSKYTNRPNGVTARRISERAGIPKRQVYRVMQSSRPDLPVLGINDHNRLVVLGVMEEFGYEYNSKLKVKRVIKVNDYLAELLGFYAAEGCVAINRTIFTFHQNEKEYHERVKFLMKEVLGLDLTLETPGTGKAHQLVFDSNIAARFFAEMCGKGALNKFFSPFLLETNPSFRRKMLGAFHCGDGSVSFSKTSSVSRYSTSSERLAYQIQEMLVSDGISASLQSHARTRNGILCNAEYTVFYTRDTGTRERKFYQKTIPLDEYVLCPIRSIETDAFDGTVWNLEVEDDNSYRVNGFAVHNCEAAACKLPVITSRYSGHTDFCNDENSYLVDVDGFQSAEKKLAWISYFYEDAEFPIFGAPAIEQTRHFMRRAFENREEAKAKAALLYDRIVKEYNWPYAVDKMYEKLKLTFGMLSGK